MELRLKQLLYQPTMLRHLALLLIGFHLGALVFGFVNFEQSQDIFQLLLSGCLGVLVVYVVFYSNPFLNRVFDWKKWTGVRLLLGILWSSISSFGLIWIGVWGYTLIQQRSNSAVPLNMEQDLKLIILLFCISVVYNIVYFAFYSYNQYATAQLLEVKRERKQAELQLATLKSQLSPHFLFNAINSLSVLFHDNTQKAETFIRSMANSYQYTLENCRKSLISVQEELDFVQSYAFLLETRFGEALRLTIDLDQEHLASKIPPLTLQLLIENAIKHNAISQAQPLEVKITGSANTLVVSNTKTPKKQASSSTGIGLKNINRRYKLLSKHHIKVEDGTHFIVTLPLMRHD